jgi:uncharacterized protein
MPDESDAPFLEIALGEGVPLVTGSLKHYPEPTRMGCHILTPRQFIDSLSESQAFMDKNMGKKWNT